MEGILREFLSWWCDSERNELLIWVVVVGLVRRALLGFCRGVPGMGMGVRVRLRREMTRKWSLMMSIGSVSKMLEMRRRMSVYLFNPRSVTQLNT